MQRTGWRLALALPLCAALAATGIAVAPTVLAAAPSGLTVAFASGDPAQGSMPMNDWRLSLTASVPTTVYTFTLTFSGPVSDGQHSVSLPNGAGNIDTSRMIVNTTGNATTGPCPAAASNGSGLDNPISITPDSVNQKITVKVQSSSTTPSSSLEICILHDALIGFPLAAGSNYHVTYADGAGSTTAAYTVNPFGGTGEVSEYIDATTTGGTDVSNAGVAGTADASVGTTYNGKLVGQANATYNIQACNSSTTTSGAACSSDGNVTFNVASANQDAAGTSSGPAVQAITDSSGTASFTFKDSKAEHMVLNAYIGGVSEGEAATGFTTGTGGGGTPTPTATPSSTPTATPSSRATPSPTASVRPSSLAATGVGAGGSGPTAPGLPLLLIPFGILGLMVAARRLVLRVR